MSNSHMQAEAALKLGILHNKRGEAKESANNLQSHFDLLRQGEVKVSRADPHAPRPQQIPLLGFKDAPLKPSIDLICEHACKDRGHMLCDHDRGGAVIGDVLKEGANSSGAAR